MEGAGRSRRRRWWCRLRRRCASAWASALGCKPGEITTGQIVAALKRLGFDQVYDTSFAADLTVIEEGNEFLERKTQGEKLPHVHLAAARHG